MNDPTNQHPGVLARGVINGDNDGYDYRRDTREGAAAKTLALAYQKAVSHNYDLQMEISRLRRELAAPILALDEYNRGFSCPKCKHLLITDQHMAAVRP